MIRHDLPRPVPFSQLPSTTSIGVGVQLYAGSIDIADDISIGNNVVIVADRIRIGPGVKIDSGVDLRAGTIEIGSRSEIHAGVRVMVAERFEIGDGSRLAKSVNVLCRDFVAKNLLYFAEGVTVGYGGTTTSTATLSMGTGVNIGPHSIINCTQPIIMGDNVGTGPYLAIWTHGYHYGHSPLESIEPTYAPVHICSNVWLGFHVTVLPGVTIGKNTIVAAGSVVNRPLPDGILAAGVPARVRKALNRVPATEPDAILAVARVLQIWRRELEWKGCQVPSFEQIGQKIEMVVTQNDGSERTRVVLLPQQLSLPLRTPDETLIIITIDDRQDIESIIGSKTSHIILRAGAIRGQMSPIIEDLRNELRRHAMPPGTDFCFFSSSHKRSPDCGRQRHRTLPNAQAPRIPWNPDVQDRGGGQPSLPNYGFGEVIASLASFCRERQNSAVRLAFPAFLAASFTCQSEVRCLSFEG